jgi:hypothetical protein
VTTTAAALAFAGATPADVVRTVIQGGAGVPRGVRCGVLRGRLAELCARTGPAPRPPAQPPAGPYSPAIRSVSVIPGPCPTRMNHSVPKANANASSGIASMNMSSLIWLG